MKKLLLLLSFVFVLAACAPAAADTTPTAIPTVNAGLATPAVGWAVVNQRAGAASAHVFASPEPTAVIVGDVPLGATGNLLGFNASNDWVLVQFENITGWMPVAVLTVTSDY